MALVSYSDSEASDDERPEAVLEVAASRASGSDKPGILRLVDKANPQKIKVSLPSLNRDNDTVTSADVAEPPSKRPKLGGGGVAGFNAMLPAPKQTARGTGGLRKGISLKTGAEPAFSREMPPMVSRTEEDEPAAPAEVAKSDPPTEDVKPTGSAMRFKPLSVARKPQKNKSVSASTASIASTSQGQYVKVPPKASKVSLFPMDASDDRTQPLGHSVETEEAQDLQSYLDSTGASMRQEQAPIQEANAQPDTLDSIASDLNLSAAARRQLLGRESKGANVKITKFNVDTEYAANEAIRRTGEQQEQQTVRAIAPGKHSLRQLVNQVAGQKDALEEQFASGRRNKKEASSKYGW